jgi:hypothetical protein
MNINPDAEILNEATFYSTKEHAKSFKKCTSRSRGADFKHTTETECLHFLFNMLNVVLVCVTMKIWKNILASVTGRNCVQSWHITAPQSRQ